MLNNRPIASSIFYTLRNSRLISVALVLSIMGSVIAAVLPPLVLEKIVSELTEEGAFSPKFAYIYFSLIVLGGLFDAAKGAMITCFGQRITTRLRELMVEKLSRLPASYFNQNESGKTLSRFTNDVDTIDTLFKSGIISMVVDLFKIVFIMVIVFTKSTGLGVLLLAAAPIIFGISWSFKRKMRAAQLDNRRAIARINNHIPETLSNARTVHSLKKEGYMKRRFREYVDQSYNAFKRTYFYEAIYTPIICEAAVLITATLMVLAAMGGNMQAFFGLKVGTAVAIISYITKIFTPIENLGMEIQNIQTAFAGIKRVDEFFSQPEKIEQTFTELSQLDLSDNAIEFQSVRFVYDEKCIFNSLNIKVIKGESVAFIGRTGAGKTTVYRLILGLYSPNSGSVRVFGVDADKISDRLKRKIFGYVEQSFKLIHGSVKDQITLGDSSISDEDVKSALNTVGLLQTVDSFEKGMYTQASTNLFSQGQFQLLSIARAVVANPIILLLDEITANLDSETEIRVTMALKAASSDRTVLNISHRMGDIRENTRVIDITKLR